MRTAILLLLFIAFCPVTRAQKQADRSDLEFLITKVHQDYPGFHDKIKNEKIAELQSLEDRLKQKIGIYPDSGYFYLRSYAEYFKDYHLKVRRAGQSSMKLTKIPVSTYGESIDTGRLNISDYRLKTSGIEGVWRSWRGNMIIIQSQNRGSFIGVALKYSGWEKGQVIYEFEFQNDTSCNVTTYSRYKEIKPAKGIATLHNNRRFLEIHDDTYFTRETDSETYDRAALMTYSPQFPNGTNTYFVTAILSDSTFYIRIPGFDGFKEQIETNLKKYAREISERPNMIIDIRNNGGGQDDEFQMLCDLIYTDPYESKNVEWYATKANIKIFEDVLVKGETDEEGIAWTKALLAEMKKNRGGFVVHPFSKNEDTMISSDTVYANPERIGIIINEGNGSSAEQFLLAAIESKKVTLFGTSPTAGVLDYSNAIGVDFPSGRYVLTIPMTRSQRLPENPIDNIGIKPDVIIPFPPTQQLYNKLDVWVEFVKNYLEIQK